MREVTYYINDHEYMRELYKEAGNLDDIMSGLPDPFVCVYTLKAVVTSGQPVMGHNYYDLTDIMGRKINMEDLNGYQRGIILCDCQKHFDGKQDNPFGVVKIEERYTEDEEKET